MVLQYTYHEEEYALSVEWHDFDGKSTIHTAIVEKLVRRHGEIFSDYRRLARELDEKADKLYQSIHIFSDEYHGVPYDPQNRARLLGAFSELCACLDAYTGADLSEPAQVLLSLFQTIQNTLQEMVGLYLAEQAYQNKHFKRLSRLETRLESINLLETAYEFDSLLTEWLTLSHMLERLTDTQRKRLLRHLYHDETIRKIAEEEGVSKQSVQESIAAAIQKLRSFL